MYNNSRYLHAFGTLPSSTEILTEAPNYYLPYTVLNTIERCRAPKSHSHGGHLDRRRLHDRVFERDSKLDYYSLK